MLSCGEPPACWWKPDKKIKSANQLTLLKQFWLQSDLDTFTLMANTIGSSVEFDKLLDIPGLGPAACSML
jgi:hypothetical protein